MLKGIPFKFGRVTVRGEDVPFDYSGIWAREETTGPPRLSIAAERDHVDLLIRLSSVLEEPFGLLYVLLVPRSERSPGRYQSAEPQSRAELEAFLTRFRDFLEGDGRHHLWVISLSDDATLVYDQHNVIFAYGPLERFETVLKEEGLQPAESVRFPKPHSHHYNEEYDEDEQAVMDCMEWAHFPLVGSEDEYG